jgi:hypothetical protein
MKGHLTFRGVFIEVVGHLPQMVIFFLTTSVGNRDSFIPFFRDLISVTRDKNQEPAQQQLSGWLSLLGAMYSGKGKGTHIRHHHMHTHGHVCVCGGTS